MKKLLNKGSKVNRSMTSMIKQMDTMLLSKGYNLRLIPSDDKLLIEIKKIPEITFGKK